MGVKSVGSKSAGAKKIITEVIVSSVEDCKVAKDANVDRIELCSSVYPEGGLTPSIGLLEKVLEIVDPSQIACMVRPRGGGFLYSDDDYETMLQDLTRFCEAKVGAVVLGFLNPDFSVDCEKLKRVVDIIQSNYPKTKCVFHRAFDLTPHANQAIDQLISCKVDRVLTSGHRLTAVEGKKEICDLVKNYSSDIEILAGSGLNYKNVKDFIVGTNVNQVHMGGHLWKADPTTKSLHIDYSYNDNCKGQYNYLDSDLVQKFVQACAGISI
ncbi:MAG: hypothetical protein LBB10_00210 [Bifidobacteriaceae bacterium]|jgi:copper homeostasis protein|nr:hypothetical protein [Bifidobacteriaceae bacterium]